jgi:uncharacterized membrane protein YcaP (DUF421 family)
MVIKKLFNPKLRAEEYMFEYFKTLTASEFFTDIGDVALRAFLSIVVLFFLTKMMGNKQISQLNLFDYAVGISIGSIAADMATNQDTPHHFSLIAMFIYAVITIITSAISRKSIKARRFFEGTPIVLIEDGQIIKENLTKASFDINELLAECRYAGYFDISQIYFAMEETDGRVSIIPKATARTATTEDLNIKNPEQVLPAANVVIDGHIINNNLKSVNMEIEDFKKRLEEHNIDYKELLLATLTKEGTLNVYSKNAPAKKYDKFA